MLHTRCHWGVCEDINHCIWLCPESPVCWQWGMWFLKALSIGRDQTEVIGWIFSPAHIFISRSLPFLNISLDISRKFFERWFVNGRFGNLGMGIFLANGTSNQKRTIRKSWHCMSMYLRKEWIFLVPKIHPGKIFLREATSKMHSQFGSNLEIWNLHGIELLIPPIHPRPP